MQLVVFCPSAQVTPDQLTKLYEVPVVEALSVILSPASAVQLVPPVQSPSESVIATEPSPAAGATVELTW